MTNLIETRNKIDEIDRKIISLFNERMKCADDVAEYKRKNNKPIYDAKREEEKLKAIENSVNDDFSKTALRELFNQIMSLSRRYQYLKLHQPATADIENFVSNNVGYFGEKGSYTERAMKHFFGNIEGTPFDSFEKVCKALEDTNIDYGVLPIENSTTGSLSDIFDFLIKYNIKILGESIEPIDHALLGLPSANVSDITEIYSHAQAIMQCSDFLNKFGRTTLAYGSTAKCANFVKSENNPSKGVIASETSAALYGLKVLKNNIANDSLNATRFILIGKDKSYIENADKISICFELPHKSGALYNLLSNFIYNNINMTKIESKPILNKRWQYRFFIDFDGNLKDADVVNAVKGIGASANKLTILGNYKSYLPV